MRKKEQFTADYTKHYVLQEIGMIKGYKLINETSETEGLTLNHIHIEINNASKTGHEFYEEIKDKFTPEKIKSKYINETNYIYTEKESNDIITIELKIMTNTKNPIDVKAKKKLLHRINKYT